MTTEPENSPLPSPAPQTAGATTAESAGMPEDDAAQPLMEHLGELRRRLLYSFLAMFAAFPVCYLFREPIYGFLLAPLASAYGSNAESKRLIFTGLTEAFFVYLKVALYAAFMLAFPLILTQIWRFVAPGLYRHEQKVLRPFLLATPLLFLAGAALAYYMVIPMAWKFFLSFESTSTATALPIQLEARVSEYLSLIMGLLFAFGLSFQLPVLLLILGMLGVVSVDMLRQGRRYAIVIILAVAAVITPPDVFSQLALALPMYLLYEISIVLMRRVVVRGRQE